MVSEPGGRAGRRASGRPRREALPERAGGSFAKRVALVLASAATVAAGAIVSGCSGTGAAGASSDAAEREDTASVMAAAPASLAADTLVPGLSRDEALARLAGIDGGTPSCSAEKVAVPGTGRAFLHERCRLDWSAPSPVAYRPADGEGPVALAIAHVDLFDGTVLRVDLVFEPTGTPALTLVDSRAERALPGLADAAPPAPLSSGTRS